jgi:hypothetical protein
MSRTTVRIEASAETANARAKSVEGVEDPAERREWESPVLTKLPAVEAGAAPNTGSIDSGVYS